MGAILIVDDSRDVRVILRTIIEQEQGLEVVAEAQNGAEALKSVETLQPDVVIMDFMMPEMDGVEATRQTTERCPTSIRVICVSGGGAHPQPLTVAIGLVAIPGNQSSSCSCFTVVRRRPCGSSGRRSTY